VSVQLYRINHQIKADQVRLLREDGTQIGIVPLQDALTQASSQGVDAVEIAPQANPPVVKLIDYKKLLYQIAKKERKEKAAAKKVDIKEIRLTPFMAENDFQVRLTRGREFLSEGNKLRVTVKFVGRQLSRKEFGAIMMNKTTSALTDYGTVDQPAKWVGRQYTATLTPSKKK
jgi:translation initiation factor IF-3